MVEGLLGAAASLETSSEKPAALKCHTRASMRADGTTFCPRHISDAVVTEVLSGMERIAEGPHRGKVGMETTTVSATKGLSELPLPPVWTVVSE